MRFLLAGLVVTVIGAGCFGDSDLSSTGSGGVRSDRKDVPPPDCGGACDTPAPAARFARLTHLQWENSVRELLRLDGPTGLSDQFTGDTLGGIFDTHTGALKIGSTLWSDYQRAAEELALRATLNADAVSRLLPVDAPEATDARARAFVESFGQRAFRRPLTADEVSRFMSLFELGPALTGVTDPMVGGARITVQAMLQSPFFLYRTELSDVVVEDAIPLNGYEVAQRLSYALWNSMPDEALFAAAASGSLSTREGVAEQALRMMADPRAREMLSRFHHQLFDLDTVRAVQRDPAKYPGTSSQLGAYLEKETALFVDEVVATQRSNLSTLLTSPTTFVNQELATLYGLDLAGGSDFQKVELPADQRSGLLTRLGFLAAYAHGPDSDPIRRGVFVNLRVLCADLPPPPDNVQPLPNETTGTMRERVTAHTGAGTCGAGCHSGLINPAGFAFEHFDGLGRYRTEDNGLPVNAADTYTLKDGTSISWSDAQAFSQSLARSRQVHRCYAQHWAEYLFGRNELAEDERLVERLTEASMEGAPVQDIVLEVVTSRSFLTRSAAEEGS